MCKLPFHRQRSVHSGGWKWSVSPSWQTSIPAGEKKRLETWCVNTEEYYWGGKVWKQWRPDVENLLETQHAKRKRPYKEKDLSQNWWGFYLRSKCISPRTEHNPAQILLDLRGTVKIYNPRTTTVLSVTRAAAKNNLDISDWENTVKINNWSY